MLWCYKDGSAGFRWVPLGFAGFLRVPPGSTGLILALRIAFLIKSYLNFSTHFGEWPHTCLLLDISKIDISRIDIKTRQLFAEKLCMYMIDEYLITYLPYRLQSKSRVLFFKMDFWVGFNSKYPSNSGLLNQKVGFYLRKTPKT